MGKVLHPPLSIGDRFGRLEVIGAPIPGRRIRYSCRCDCGTAREVLATDLRAGKVKSCGCLKHETKPKLRHGYSHSPLYAVWQNMRQRCTDPRAINYADYGGRGITVCAEWQTFDGFLEWAKDGYRLGVFIDRIDNDGGYSPDNCRWVTRTENNRNRRSTVRVTAFGETKLVIEWAEDPRCQVSYDVLLYRIRKGYDPERSITAPPRARSELWGTSLIC